MRMEIIDLDRGEDLEVATQPRDEAAVMLVAGELEAGPDRAARPSAFEPRLAGWYLPPGESWRARALAPATVLTVTTVGADLKPTGGDVASIEAADGETRGRDEWERTVITLIEPGSVGSQRLIAGQTSHVSGGWSSYPPHRHDGTGDEPYFEEIYHYRFDPPAGFGFQGLYSDEGAEAHLVRDGDTLTIAQGYHPVCAAPGYRFTYFWLLCGPAERFEQVDDPVHEWVAR
jgi:5-deoxy-glucuronate isomerase